MPRGGHGLQPSPTLPDASGWHEYLERPLRPPFAAHYCSVGFGEGPTGQKYIGPAGGLSRRMIEDYHLSHVLEKLFHAVLRCMAKQIIFQNDGGPECSLPGLVECAVKRLRFKQAAKAFDSGRAYASRTFSRPRL